METMALSTLMKSERMWRLGHSHHSNPHLRSPGHHCLRHHLRNRCRLSTAHSKPLRNKLQVSLLSSSLRLLLRLVCKLRLSPLGSKTKATTNSVGTALVASVKTWAQQRESLMIHSTNSLVIRMPIVIIQACSQVNRKTQVSHKASHSLVATPKVRMIIRLNTQQTTVMRTRATTEDPMVNRVVRVSTKRQSLSAPLAALG